MRLTFANRIKLAVEVLTTTSGHGHPSDEKQLSTFRRGYDAGMQDARLMQASADLNAGADFDEAARSMMGWMHKHCHPHHTVVITSEFAELSEGRRVINREEQSWKN
jgi:hypothetical protein